jgi:steroid 5-alpha reductase family enzyme
MRFPHLDKIERTAELLALLFYALMAVALLAALVGSTGSALALLLIGAALHVVRFSLELFADAQGPRRARPG